MGDANRIGAIGFCFGGAMGLNLARSGARLRVISSNHGEYPYHDDFNMGDYNVDYFLEMIGHDDILIPEAHREEWKEELKGNTEGTTKEYEMIIWPSPNVHGFSIEYSPILYNVFQLFGLNHLAVYNKTCANLTFTRIHQLFTHYGLLAQNSPRIKIKEPTRPDPPPLVLFLEWLAWTFNLQPFYTGVFVPLVGGFFHGLDPEGENIGGVLFFFFLIIIFVLTCCCSICCCCWPIAACKPLKCCCCIKLCAKCPPMCHKSCCKKCGCIPNGTADIKTATVAPAPSSS